MADEAQRIANLTRIRQNQRRSRARRKEYVEELEAKWRTCETIGVEASAQIQDAARKVLHENRRLRQLLRRLGVSDVQIEAAVSLPASGSAGAEGGEPAPPRPTAAEALEATLDAKWACGGGQPQAQAQTFRMGPGTAATQAQEGYEREPMSLLESNGAHQGMPSSFVGLNGAELQQQQQQQQRQPYFPMPVPVPDVQMWPPFESDISARGSSLPLPVDASSCLAVADVVRSMRPGMGQHAEAEMGCEDGEDCDVPNAMAFDLLDRFSG